LAGFQLQTIVLGVEMKSDESLKAQISLHHCELRDDEGITRSVNPLTVILTVIVLAQDDEGITRSVNSLTVILTIIVLAQGDGRYHKVH